MYGPLLESVNDRKQLALVHRIIYFGSGELSKSKSNRVCSFFTFLPNKTPIITSLASHFTICGLEGSANCSTGAVLTAFLRL
jgi:hypothetical protein